MSDCAVGPDDTLLDVKDIEWYEDADSLEPIKQAATSSFTTTASSSVPIHPFFRHGPAPAVVVAGVRHSGHATHPSNRITDPDNAESLSSNMTHKCKHSGSTAASHRLKHRAAIDDGGSTDSRENDNYEPDVTEDAATMADGEASDTEPEEDPNLAYASTKAMGDADREVGFLIFINMTEPLISFRPPADILR